MSLEEQLGTKFEGLGEEVWDNEFSITMTDGHTVETDSIPESFNPETYAPFHFEIGDTYSRLVYDAGEFVTSYRTKKTYLLVRGIKPIRVEGDIGEVDISEFIKKVEAIGKKNKFNRLLSEEKIEALVRTHAYMGNGALLEVAVAESSRMNWMGPRNPFEAYSILVDLTKGSMRIVEAGYRGGPFGFNEEMSDLKEAKDVAIPEGFLEIAQPGNICVHHDFKPLPKEIMRYIRENCYRAKRD